MFAHSQDDHRIAYQSIGIGRPIVFLHGFSDSGQSWIEAGHVERALCAGRRAILVDVRGHGASDKPHDGALYAPRRLAADVVAVLDDLAVDEADLIGFSMGGGIALATALFSPERVGSLAMIGAHCFAQDMSLFRRALEVGTEGMTRLVEGQGMALSEAARRRFLANDVRPLRALVANDRPDRSALLATLRRPLIALAGTDDPAFEPICRMAKQAKGDFVALEGRNHFTSFLAADEISRTVLAFFDAGTSRKAGLSVAEA